VAASTPPAVDSTAPRLDPHHPAGAGAPEARPTDLGFKIAIAVAVAAGLGLRLWMMTGRIGVLDSDGAVPGLMALHIRSGDFPAFYWGQAYGGSIESFVAAAFFYVVPATAFTLTLVPVGFCAGCALMVWRLGVRLAGARAGLVAAALFWVPSIGLLWWSTKVGTYWSGLFLTLSALLLLVRARDAQRWPVVEVLGFGVLAGLAWWANPQSVYLLAPAGVVYLPRLLGHWRRFPLAVGGFVVGAAPWLVFNLDHHWASLDSPPQLNDAPNHYTDHLVNFFKAALPMALGLRQPFTREWVFGGPGKALYLVTLAGLAWICVSAVRRRSPLIVVVAIFVAYPFLYALSPFSWFTGLPRYMLFVLPALCLLAGSLAAWPPWRSIAALGVAGVLVVAGVAGILRTGTLTGAPDAPLPVRLDGLERLLVDHGVHRAFANYWIAYRVTFELHERVLVTPITSSRYQPIDAAVRRAKAPAYLFVDHSSWLIRFRQEIVRRHLAVHTFQRGPWVLVIPRDKLLPEEIPEAWAA
jgi:hypothetical protein